jgi:SAM-dependent methyltransferase
VDKSGPNAEQISYWNEISGPKWVALGDTIDQQIAPIGLDGIEAAAIAAGERVLDVGCGCGHTSLELSTRVGNGGAVVGLDISGPMLEDARRRASEAGRSNLEFIQADAQTHGFGSDAFDLIFSRFGVMFFEDPEAAFRNLLGALRPGGRLVFLCWQEIGRNPWMLAPAAAAAKHVEMPAPPPPGSPGPFAFADRERVSGILSNAGFDAVGAKAIERSVVMGRGLDLEQAANFVMQMGPAGAALREAGDEVVRAAAASVQEALEPFQTADGIEMDAACWLFSASRLA